jgi:site-specific DNA recombinase
MKIKERFRLGKLRKVKEGHLLVSEPLYGYTYIKMKDDVHGYYVINEEEARVVRMIFKWVGEEGLTQLKTIKRLQELGIKPRRSKRGVWATSSLTTMLRHKGYIGQAHWGSTYAVVPQNPRSLEKYRKVKKSSRKIKAQEEWIVSDIPVPAIIDEALFYRVRDRIETNARNNKRNTKNEYMLTGVIYCTCGRRRCGEGAQKGKHLYYRCTDRIHNYPFPKQCEQQGINAKIADKLVWDKVSTLMGSPTLLSKQITRWLGSKQTKNVFNTGDATRMEKEIDKLKIEEDRYTKAYGSGIFTIEQLKDYLGPIKDKKLALEIQIQKAKSEEKEISSIEVPNKNQIEEFAVKAREAMANLSFSVKKGIMMNIIEKIISGNNQLQICGYIPITNENTNVAFISSHRNSGASKCW